MLAYVGMNPQDDVVHYCGQQSMSAMQLFVEGKSDAFLAFAPAPQELRARKIGRVIVNTTQDRPWSQYFCCLVVANREFTDKYPGDQACLESLSRRRPTYAPRSPSAPPGLLVERATNRATRSPWKAKELPYRRWRENHPEDTFASTHCACTRWGMIKSTPQKLIAQATDWRFLNEIRRELKA